MVVGGSVVKGAPTWEVRWIRPGVLAAATIDWFSRFVGHVESREDTYLVGRRIQGVSVKIRGSALLEVKVAMGDEDRERLDMPGCARLLADTLLRDDGPSRGRAAPASPGDERHRSRRVAGRSSVALNQHLAAGLEENLDGQHQEPDDHAR